MRAITADDGRTTDDLAPRLADSVVEALISYMAEPLSANAEYVQTISAALQSLATLEIAEQLQSLNGMLAPSEVAA